MPGFANIVAADPAKQPRINNAAGTAVSVTATDIAGSRNGVEIRGPRPPGQRQRDRRDRRRARTSVGVTISDNTVRGAGMEGIDLNGGSTGLFTATVQTNTIAATGNGFDARNTAGTLQILSAPTPWSPDGTAVVVDGSLGPANSLTITAFANNTVNGNTAGSGISVTSATFDATPGGSFNAVSAGNTPIGASGNGVGGGGFVLTNAAGDLSFTDLDVFADGGAGLRASGTTAYTGSAGLQITVPAGASTVTATGGPAVDLNTVTANLPFAADHAARTARPRACRWTRSPGPSLPAPAARSPTPPAPTSSSTAATPP